MRILILDTCSSGDATRMRLDGGGDLWPASVVLDGEYGIRGVAVSVPVTIGRGGAEEIHEWDLSGREREALHASAEFVRAAAASIPA